MAQETNSEGSKGKPESEAKAEPKLSRGVTLPGGHKKTTNHKLRGVTLPGGHKK